jgi:hypothetical protein
VGLIIADPGLYNDAMVSSSAATVADYLKSLPEDRRRTIAAVRRMFRKHLPRGMVEVMNWGMICYEIPLKTYPVTYNGQPLCYGGLASQKHYCSLYLSCVYQDSTNLCDLKQAFAAAGRKLNMGKGCIRFRSADDLPLEAIGAIIAGMSVEAFIAQYESARATAAAASRTRRRTPTSSPANSPSGPGLSRSPQARRAR